MMTGPQHFVSLRWLFVLAGTAGLGMLLAGCSQSESPKFNQNPRFGNPQAQSETKRDQPPSAPTLYSMADILAAQGKDRECEFVLRRCVQEYPQFSPAYNKLAELQMRQGRVHEAVDVLTKVLHLRPRDPVLLNNLGMCYLVRKEYPKAVASFTDAAGSVPESAKYRANLAASLALLGRQEEATALLQQILPEEQVQHNAEILRKAYEKAARPAASVQG
jgi:Flp pilus assembly protein TadD